MLLSLSPILLPIQRELNSLLYTKPHHGRRLWELDFETRHIARCLEGRANLLRNANDSLSSTVLLLLLPPRLPSLLLLHRQPQQP